MAENKLKNEYDFKGKNPNDILTTDELKHFDEGMRPKNQSRPVNEINFNRAAEATSKDLDKLLP